MYNNPYRYGMSGDRQFVFPFLVGALAGGTAVGLTRPRPIVGNFYQPYPVYRPPYYGPGYGGFSSYYYRPY